MNEQPYLWWPAYERRYLGEDVVARAEAEVVALAEKLDRECDAARARAGAVSPEERRRILEHYARLFDEGKELIRGWAYRLASERYAKEGA